MEWSDQFGQVSDDGCGHHEIADESQVVRVENRERLFGRREPPEKNTRT
jgi:hypothetical protein